jgi:hypothetical protein
MLKATYDRWKEIKDAKVYEDGGSAASRFSIRRTGVSVAGKVAG